MQLFLIELYIHIYIQSSGYFTSWMCFYQDIDGIRVHEVWFDKTPSKAKTTVLKWKTWKICQLEKDYNQAVLARMAALLPVRAWNPDLMLVTEQREPQVSHCKKKILVSFWRSVSGDRHVWQVTYSSVKNKQSIL